MTINSGHNVYPSINGIYYVLSKINIGHSVLISLDQADLLLLGYSTYYGSCFLRAVGWLGGHHDNHATLWPHLAS